MQSKLIRKECTERHCYVDVIYINRKAYWIID